MTLVDILRSLERRGKRVPDDFFIRSGKRVPDELWPVRRKKKRLPLIDDLLAKIERQLRSIDFQVPTEPLDPKQYQQALQDSPYQPLLEAIQAAHTVVSAYRRGRINGKNIRRVWPKGRRNLPHMDKIIALKKELHNNMAPIHLQHKRWHVEYQKKLEKAQPDIDQGEQHIQEADRLLTSVHTAYESLKRTLSDGALDPWLSSVAMHLDVDADYRKVLARLESYDRDAVAHLLKASEIHTRIKESLGESSIERRLASVALRVSALVRRPFTPMPDPSYSDYQEKGLDSIGALKTGTFFWENERFSKLVEGMENMNDLYGVCSAFEAHTEHLRSAVSRLKDLEFSFTFEMMDIDGKTAQAEGLLEKLYGSGLDDSGLGVKLYFRKRIEKAVKNIPSETDCVIQTYGEACDRLKTMATVYLKNDFFIEDGLGLVHTIQDLAYLIPRIEAAKEFAGIAKKKRIVTKAELSQLQELRSVVLEARDNIEDSNYIRMFTNEMESVERYIDRWGIPDCSVGHSISSARGYLNIAPQQPITPDPRVAPLFQGMASIDPALVTKLEGWEQQIEKL